MHFIVLAAIIISTGAWSRIQTSTRKTSFPDLPALVNVAFNFPLLSSIPEPGGRTHLLSLSALFQYIFTGHSGLLSDASLILRIGLDELSADHRWSTSSLYVAARVIYMPMMSYLAFLHYFNIVIAWVLPNHAPPAAHRLLAVPRTIRLPVIDLPLQVLGTRNTS
jgi:hypothetical protein